MYRSVTSAVTYQEGGYAFPTCGMLILREELRLWLQLQNLQLFAPCCWVSSLPDKGVLTSWPVEESPKIFWRFWSCLSKSRGPETHIGRQPGNTGQNRWCNMVEASSFQERVQILTHNFAMSLSHLKSPHHPKGCLLSVTWTGSRWIYNSVP